VRAAAIVVNWNAEAHLPRCLAAITGQTHPFDRIVVADNASEDKSLDTVARDFPQVEVFRIGSNAGFAYANNFAINMLPDCDLVALVNPDAFLDPAWLQQMLAAAEADVQCAGFGSRLLMAEQPDLLDGAGDAYHVGGLVWRIDHGTDAANHGLKPGSVFSPCAAAALYRRHALAAVGGFDEDFFCYVEDVDLGFRLRLAGYSCSYVPSALAWHIGSASTGRDSAFAVYHGHRNLVWAYGKNMPSPQVWLYLPLHLLFTLVSLVRCAARGRALPFLRAKLDAIIGLPRMLAKRRATQSSRRVGWRELSAAMAHGWPRRSGGE
jgi:GT2 family glycosyltransferase